MMLNLFHPGDLNEEDELLTWTLYQMRENTIENVNRDLLAMLVDKQELLAVFFCKPLLEPLLPTG